MARLSALIRIAWNLLREACGENDYARYRARVLATGCRAMPPKDFYLRQLQNKYSRPSRCC